MRTESRDTEFLHVYGAFGPWTRPRSNRHVEETDEGS
jgi:hypothetical protein